MKRRLGRDNLRAARTPSMLALITASGPALRPGPSLRTPAAARTSRHVVCAAAEAEDEAAAEARTSGVRGAQLIGFAGGAYAGRCARSCHQRRIVSELSLYAAIVQDRMGRAVGAGAGEARADL